MVGPVVSSPIPVGQGQNSYQQAQATQGPAQVEQRDPRPDEVQRRNAPAAQNQENAAESSKSPRQEEVIEFREREARLAEKEESNDNPRETESRGELLDVLV